MKINNIFSALAREKTPGVVQEFVLWILSCVVVLLAMTAAIIGRGVLPWIMLMLFGIGLAILLAFRLKAITMIYGLCAFEFLCNIMLYFYFNRFHSWYWHYSTSILNTILIVLLIALGIALIACQFVHAFTKTDLGNIVTIMVCVDAGLSVILHILLFALPSFDGDIYFSSFRDYLNGNGYWIGTFGLWLAIAVITCLFIFSFWGKMDSNRGKVLTASAYTYNPGLYGVQGAYAGQTITFRGGVFLIGSGPGTSLRIPDNFVSGRHCSIRFNNATGFYEILDESTNGTFIANGGYLPKGVYQSVQRGSVICIGSAAQQFKLL